MFRIISLLISVFISLNVAASIRLASYNIRNFDYDERSHTPTNKSFLVETIEELNADILAVQEINEKEVFKRMIEKNFFGKYSTELTNCGGHHEQKLGFVYNTTKYTLINFEEDLRTSNPNDRRQTQRQNCNQGSRPLAIATFENKLTHEKIVAISVHLKSGGRPKSIQKRFQQHAIIRDVVKNLKQRGLNRIVVMGDFNSTEYILKNNNQQKFVQSVQQMDMLDSTKNLKCSAYWWGGVDDGEQYPSTLDHILVSPELLGSKSKTITTTSYGHCKALNCQVTDERFMGISFDQVSDHCPVVTEVK